MATNPANSPSDREFPLTDEHAMLLQMRDSLYEGAWDDFLADLRSRAKGRAHVFATTPDSPDMTDTIARHIVLIEAMKVWEDQNGRALSPPVV